MNPPWMSEIEDGNLVERPRRYQAPQVEDGIQGAIRYNLPMLVNLGFSHAQALHALEACRGNLDLAVALLFDA